MERLPCPAPPGHHITHALRPVASTSRLAPACPRAVGAPCRASNVNRTHVVRCRAVAATERPRSAAQPGPIIMNGQVLHSITQERLELVKSLGPYMEQQVRCAASADVPRMCAHDQHCTGCGV